MHSHKRQFRNVTTHIVDSGFGKFLHEFDLLHHLPIMDFRNRDSFAESIADGKALARVLEELGPGFVEAGRIIASRSDVIPLQYQNALLNNTSNVPVMDEKKLAKLIRREIGKSKLSEIESIEPKPYRSNLVSQTNKAILKNGKRVLVTVNDPRTVYSLGRNLEAIRELAPAIKQKFAGMIFENLLEELERRAGLLSDLSVVGARLEMLDAHFGHHAKVHIPEVLWEYTSRSVLVQRWHQEPDMREIARGDKKTASSKKYINRYLAEAFAYQYGVGGVFVLRPLLSDMQVGSSNRVILNHLLGTGYLEPEERTQFTALLYALLSGEPELAAKVLLAGHYTKAHGQDFFSSGIRVPKQRQAPVSELVWELLEYAWHGNVHVPLGLSMAAESVLYLEHALGKFDSEASLNDNLRLAIKKYIPEIFGLKKNATVQEIVSQVIS